LNTQPDLTSILRPGTLLDGCPDDSLQRLQAAGTVRTYPKGQTFFQKGDDGDYFAIILQGRLKMCTFSAAGKETVLNILQEGDMVGEIAALDGGLRTADAIPIDDATLLQISRGSVLSLMEEDSDFAISLTMALCSKLRAASDAVEANSLDMSRRVAAALLRLARQNETETDAGELKYEINIDQTTLSQYAGLTRSNVNRVLKKFEQSGAASHDKGVLKILDTEWLEDYANSDDDL